MKAACILLIFGVLFLIAATVRFVRDGQRLHPQSKTWFIIAAIFIAVGGWLVARS